MKDPEEYIRATARYYGHSEDDALAARDLLGLTETNLVVRFNEVAAFARTFGVNIKSLAALIADTGSGIAPWEASDRYTSEDWRRIRDAEEHLATGGDWAGTILRLLDEVDRLKGGGDAPTHPASA